jgi:cell division protein FtsL
LSASASALSGEEKMTTITIIVAVLLGIWIFHKIGAVLDARLARKELEARIAELDQVVEDASTTTHLRARRLMDRKRPIGRLLAAVRDEPTIPLR